MKTTIAYLLFACMAFAPVLVLGQQCETSFTSHKEGATITSYPVEVAGIAKVPVEGHVWILAHHESMEGVWYPQGGRERNNTNSKWKCPVYLGGGKETGTFEIAIAVVNDAENKKLKEWVSKQSKDNYIPTEISGLLCPMTIIKVEKQ